MITLLGESGKERGPPFLECGELSPELFQLAVDLWQFGPRLPFLQVSITMTGPDQILDLAAEQPPPWVPVHRGGPILQLACVDRREDLILREPILRASRLIAQRRALTSPFFDTEFHRRRLSTGTELPPAGFAGLPADELAEAGADHGDARSGLTLVVPGLSLTQQGLTVLGPGEVQPAQDLLEHCVDRLRVGSGQAAKRQRADRLPPQVPAQQLRVPLVGRENRVGEKVASIPYSL